MRYFISIDITDEDVKQSIMKFTSDIESLGDTKTVPPEKLHITVFYIGEREKSDESDLRSSFIDSCEGLRVGEFTCNLENAGVFPHMKYIETIWIGAKPREKLDKLHMNFSEYFNRENEHDFVPHVTVARVRGIGPDEKTVLQEEIERNQREFGTFTVDRVRLKRSAAAEGGRVYHDMEVYEL
ncbi:MAG: RNA 2',3'-cyclic phosphodiesterase [Candidatus Nanohaloarchaea archaeon]|nr:RNA 2',3'-cyclic phosphodiesterase [Candidatus Nanohaloarchaea archaeon]